MAEPKRLSAIDVAFAKSLLIYEDAEVYAFNKPAGLSSQGGRIAVSTLDDLMAVFAKPSGVRPRLVHRLDRDTSGVLLAARSQPAAAFLGRALMSRRVSKSYLAIVSPGAPEPRSGVIERALARRDIGREAYVQISPEDAPGAKAAVTRYRTLKSDDVAALMDLGPRTGRMHQLRVHMASIGRSIAGDARYGGALALYGELVPRLMLHAKSLVFPHPAGGEQRIEAPPPSDFARLADRIAA